MNKLKVYLAGPITGLTYDSGQNWRDWAKAFLSEISDGRIEAYSPLRHKDYLRKEGELKAEGYNTQDTPLSTQRGITARDRYDCMESDLILFNFLGAKAVSIGTIVEVGWADAARRPMVAAIELEGNLHAHAIVKECIPFQVPTLEEACLLVRHILLP